MWHFKEAYSNCIVNEIHSNNSTGFFFMCKYGSQYALNVRVWVRKCLKQGSQMELMVITE